MRSWTNCGKPVSPEQPRRTNQHGKSQRAVAQKPTAMPSDQEATAWCLAYDARPAATDSSRQPFWHPTLAIRGRPKIVGKHLSSQTVRQHPKPHFPPQIRREPARCLLSGLQPGVRREAQGRPERMNASPIGRHGHHSAASAPHRLAQGCRSPVTTKTICRETAAADRSSAG